LQADPYKGAFPNYGYACGYCTGIKRGPIRDQCFTCLANTTGTTVSVDQCLEQAIRATSRGELHSMDSTFVRVLLHRVPAWPCQCNR